MNKKIKIAMVAVVATTVAGMGIYSSQKFTDVTSDIMLANMEALADGESSGMNCRDACKEWSGSRGGGIACDCGRYTGKCKNRC